MTKGNRRALAIILCLVMCLSLLQVSSLAEEEQENETVAALQEAETTVENRDTVSEENSEPEQPAVEETVDHEESSDEPEEEPEGQTDPENKEEIEQVPVQEPEAADPALQTEDFIKEETSEEVEKPAPSEAQGEAERAKTVSVTFQTTPEDAEITLYTKDDEGEKRLVVPEEDGTYLLLPGEYYYDAAAEGYKPIKEEELIIEDRLNAENTEEPIEIRTTMQPVEEQASLTQEEKTAKPEEDKDSSEVSMMALEGASASGAGFTDVANPSDYFYEPVYWAVDRGITTGRTATTFDPWGKCTRGHIVTFLWRAMDKPEPTGSNPFSDVKESDGFYKAVLWAVDNGITTGKTATTFDPWNYCTRGQIVTFLWRAMDKPEPSISNPFSDVKESDGFYKAVLWAVDNGITTGKTATTFDPWATCSRGQAVTFLYRALNMNPSVPEFVFEDINSTTARLIRYNGNDSSVTVPQTHDGKTVTEIGPEVFLNNTTLMSIDLPDTIKVIGARAFKNCINLGSMS